MKTLIIIDVQNDFIPGGTLEVPEGDKIIQVINRIQDKFDLVIATQDWHPSNHISFASNHKDKKPFEKIEWRGMPQILWPDHCVQNTHGADFPHDLNMAKTEAIFRKGMDWQIDSYSGFYDNGHQKNTGLASYLRERKAKDLFFCGLAADVCVWFSIIDALKEGFYVTLIEDATKPIDVNEFVIIKEEIKKLGGKIVMSDDISSR
ncbi:MAG: bifunctional nicotinamidase/pyrazinamidase [Bacteroidales bacterium]|nr:bifunctional nicotinamidase/pyrazinamidase [Bacteroidales bacterium]